MARPPSDPLNRKSLRRALRAWDNSAALGESPLAKLRQVDIKRAESGYGEIPLGFGIALREVLRGGIEALRPAGREPLRHDAHWRSYLILTGRYIHGRSPEFLATELAIARSTYDHSQATAHDRLVALLREWEEQASVDRDLDPRPAAVPFMAPPGAAHGLTGREAMLSELAARFTEAGASNALGLYGLPGVGKTALAVELAHGVREHFDGGVLWATLGPEPELTVQFHLWEAALGLSHAETTELTGLKDRARLLHMMIGEKRVLMIVDDVWEEGAARSFEVGGPNCSYLFTTRSPRLATSLAGAGTTKVPELDDEHGVALLERYLPKAKVRLRGKERELVRSVGGLPQALVIIGAALRREGYADQPRRLNDFLEGLEDPSEWLSLEQSRSALDQHAGVPADQPITLQAVIALSEATLEPGNREMLLRLSLFPPKPNTFDEQAAKRVSGGAVRELDRLVDAGLLETGGPNRYAIHRTIAEYGKAASGGELPADKFVRYYAELVVSPEMRTAPLDAELSNVLATLRIAEGAGFDLELVDLLSGAFELLEMNGLLAETLEMFPAAIEAARPLRPASKLIRTLLASGKAAQRLGHQEQAATRFGEAAERAAEGGYAELECEALAGLGVVAFSQGDRTAANRYYARGLELARKSNIAECEAILLSNLGTLTVSRGESGAAAGHFQRAHAIALAEGNQRLVGTVLTNLGVIAAQARDFGAASAYFEEAIELARADSNRRVMSFLHANLGALAHDQGDDERAIGEFEQALDLSRQLGDVTRMSHVLANLGALETARADYPRAEEYLGEGLRLARDSANMENTILLLINTAELRKELGKTEEAKDLLAEAKELAQESGRERYLEIAAQRLKELDSG